MSYKGAVFFIDGGGQGSASFNDLGVTYLPITNPSNDATLFALPVSRESFYSNPANWAGHYYYPSSNIPQGTVRPPMPGFTNRTADQSHAPYFFDQNVQKWLWTNGCNWFDAVNGEIVL